VLCGITDTSSASPSEGQAVTFGCQWKVLLVSLTTARFLRRPYHQHCHHLEQGKEMPLPSAMAPFTTVTAANVAATVEQEQAAPFTSSAAAVATKVVSFTTAGALAKVATFTAALTAKAWITIHFGLMVLVFTQTAYRQDWLDANCATDAIVSAAYDYTTKKAAS